MTGNQLLMEHQVFLFVSWRKDK